MFDVCMKNAALFPLGTYFGGDWQGLSVLMILSAFHRVRNMFFL